MMTCQFVLCLIIVFHACVPEATGEVFFHNTLTGEMVWELPTPSTAITAATAPSPVATTAAIVEFEPIEGSASHASTLSAAVDASIAETAIASMSRLPAPWHVLFDSDTGDEVCAS